MYRPYFFSARLILLILFSLSTLYLTTSVKPSSFAPNAAEPLQPGQLQFSAGLYSVNEGAGSVTITVTRTNGSDGTVTVDYFTSDDTAKAGSDYVASMGTLTFGPG